MAILDELRRDRGLAMLFITHDLELAGAVCDRTVVMYAGQVVEIARLGPCCTTTRCTRTRPRSLQARPDIAGPPTGCVAIPGRPLSAFEAPSGCRVRAPLRARHARRAASREPGT